MFMNSSLIFNKFTIISTEFVESGAELLSPLEDRA